MADIRALYADEDGNILDAPKGFQALARTGTDIIELSPDDLIPLPESADLMFLPDRLPLAKYAYHGQCRSCHLTCWLYSFIYASFQKRR